MKTNRQRWPVVAAQMFGLALAVAMVVMAVDQQSPILATAGVAFAGYWIFHIVRTWRKPR